MKLQLTLIFSYLFTIGYSQPLKWGKKLPEKLLSEPSLIIFENLDRSLSDEQVQQMFPEEKSYAGQEEKLIIELHRTLKEMGVNSTAHWIMYAQWLTKESKQELSELMDSTNVKNILKISVGHFYNQIVASSYNGSGQWYFAGDEAMLIRGKTKDELYEKLESKIKKGKLPTSNQAISTQPRILKEYQRPVGKKIDGFPDTENIKLLMFEFTDMLNGGEKQHELDPINKSNEAALKKSGFNYEFISPIERVPEDDPNAYIIQQFLSSNKKIIWGPGLKPEDRVEKAIEREERKGNENPESITLSASDVRAVVGYRYYLENTVTGDMYFEDCNVFATPKEALDAFLKKLSE